MDATARARIPNALTLSRVALAGMFFAVLSLRSVWGSAGGGIGGIDVWLLVAAGIFMIAALTDAIDGHLARKWNAVSTFGRIMDPFADKVLVLGAFVYLAGPGFGEVRLLEPGSINEQALRFQTTGVAVWMAVVIVARELLVTSIRGVFESQGIDFSAGWAGKWKMILQSIAIPLILLILAFARPWPGEPLMWVIEVTVWATVIVTVWSGLPYIKRAVRASPPLPRGEEMSIEDRRGEGPRSEKVKGRPEDPHPSPLPGGEGAKNPDSETR
jgi:CDP-diacylglycerol---glycerol-3-phosphate 3-phosphatidyltransferase